MGLRTLRKKLSRYKIKNYLEDKAIDKAYKDACADFRQRHVQTNKIHAVVVHLFHVENLPLFKSKLKYLQTVHKFDLFITCPEQNISFIKDLKKNFPDAEYLVCPNKGRDVLPFIMIAKILSEWNYQTVLKFHSKKSTHWDGGQTWLEKTLDQIIPVNEQSLHEIVRVITNSQTGVVGPSEFYYPLTVNFPANGAHMSDFVIKHYGKENERYYLQTHRSDYGFYGGTMLWMRINAIEKLFTSTPRDFEPEAGQIDGTYAHAVERLLCLLPQIENRTNYECDGQKVSIRQYKTNNIPEWSIDHDK